MDGVATPRPDDVGGIAETILEPRHARICSQRIPPAIFRFGRELSAPRAASPHGLAQGYVAYLPRIPFPPRLLEVIVGDEVFILGQGDTLIAPRDIPHQLRNSGNAENHYLLMFSPSGFEGFLKATAVPAPANAVAPTKPPAVAVRRCA
jgi:Cupin domain